MKGKMDTFQKIVAAGIIIIMVVVAAPMLGFTYGVKPTAPDIGPAIAGCDLPANPTVTIATPDLYGGAAVTTKNVVRLAGTADTWTEIAGAGTFEADPGDKYEIIIGIGDANTEDDDQPFGPKILYTVPCKSEPSIIVEVVDDSVEGDVTNRTWDIEDGTVISHTAPIDIDQGDVFSLKSEWQGAFEEDYGNRFCDKGNALVFEYPTSNFTKIYATDLAGNKYPSCSTPDQHTLTDTTAATSCYEVPVLQSNALWSFYIVIDASGGTNNGDGGTANVTMHLYDVNWYLDNDVSPPAAVCGWEDEDNNDLGSTGKPNPTIYIEND